MSKSSINKYQGDIMKATRYDGRLVLRLITVWLVIVAILFGPKLIKTYNLLKLRTNNINHIITK